MTSYTYHKVDRMGIEPTTPCLQSAVAPLVHAGPNKDNLQNRRIVTL